MYTHTHMYFLYTSFLQMYTHIHTHTCISYIRHLYRRIHTYTHTHIHTHMYFLYTSSLQTYSHIHTHTYTHTYVFLIYVISTDVYTHTHTLPGGTVVKKPPRNAADFTDRGLIPGWGRSSGAGNGNPLQSSCMGNPMDRGARWATGRGVTRSGHE